MQELSSGGDGHVAPTLQPEDMAFLQYTSGSTGTPKGVILTHANLLANIRAMGQVAGTTSRETFVSWLPLYHDMGLIGACMGSLYYACPLVLMSPLAFLARPQRWLWAIHQHRGTISAAPNFAYELCLRRIDALDIEQVWFSTSDHDASVRSGRILFGCGLSTARPWRPPRSCRTRSLHPFRESYPCRRG